MIEPEFVDESIAVLVQDRARAAWQYSQAVASDQQNAAPCVIGARF